MKPAPYAKESDLCAAFIEAIPEDWTAYPETGGFDILLARRSDGFQIGIEAKLRLNAKVVLQAAERTSSSYVAQPGPDCRAVLVPETSPSEIAALCGLIGVTVIRMDPPPATSRGVARYRPFLPTGKPYGDDGWHELCPAKRLTLPDWVPDVTAGASAPVALTDWKIRAIKIAVTLDRRGYVTRQDFAFHRVSMSRWTQSRWLVQDGRGGWVAGPHMPDFRAQHPVNFGQIEADYEKWRDPSRGPTAGAATKQEALL